MKDAVWFQFRAVSLLISPSTTLNRHRTLTVVPPRCLRQRSDAHSATLHQRHREGAPAAPKFPPAAPLATVAPTISFAQRRLMLHNGKVRKQHREQQDYSQMSLLLPPSSSAHHQPMAPSMAQGLSMEQSLAHLQGSLRMAQMVTGRQEHLVSMSEVRVALRSHPTSS